MASEVSASTDNQCMNLGVEFLVYENLECIHTPPERTNFTPHIPVCQCSPHAQAETDKALGRCALSPEALLPSFPSSWLASWSSFSPPFHRGVPLGQILKHQEPANQGWNLRAKRNLSSVMLILLSGFCHHRGTKIASHFTDMGTEAQTQPQVTQPG